MIFMVYDTDSCFSCSLQIYQIQILVAEQDISLLRIRSQWMVQLVGGLPITSFIIKLRIGTQG